MSEVISGTVKCLPSVGGVIKLLKWEARSGKMGRREDGEMGRLGDFETEHKGTDAASGIDR